MLSDNMSSDTLFSTISQFPFPDSREIGEWQPSSVHLTHSLISFFCPSTARAGRADFIQPSLGPLQPNFEDFMDFDLGEHPIQHLTTPNANQNLSDIFNSLTNNRLAPVPEEQTEELLKAIEFPMIGEPIS